MKAGEPSVRIIRIAIHNFRDPDTTTAIKIVDDDDDDDVWPLCIALVLYSWGASVRGTYDTP